MFQLLAWAYVLGMLIFLGSASGCASVRIIPQEGEEIHAWAAFRRLHLVEFEPDQWCVDLRSLSPLEAAAVSAVAVSAASGTGFIAAIAGLIAIDWLGEYEPSACGRLPVAGDPVAEKRMEVTDEDRNASGGRGFEPEQLSP